MIAFLGTGLLGANFVRALRRRDEAVQVWNRSPEKAKALEREGAKAFAEVSQAVRGASRVHLCLSDDAAVDAVLELAKVALDPGVVLVDHTTTSPAGTAERARRWAARGIGFQHAPVLMSPQHALEAKGLMLTSGDKARHEALAPALEQMTGRLVYLGPLPERAAGLKLLGNLFLMSLQTGITDTLALGKALQIPPAETTALFDLMNPGAMVGPRFKRTLEGDFAHPSWELAMARKDARLMLEAAARGGASLVAIPAVAAEMDRWLAKGHAHDDWTVIAKDVVG